MSYYASNYYLNPGPIYGGSDKDEPVPGWGPLPNMAGGARVGIGAVAKTRHDIAPRYEQQQQVQALVAGEEPPAPSPLPWWVWIVGAGALGAGVAVARNRKWF
jgi:hypothetical protein